MKSYTEGRNLYGSWTKNTASANLTLGDQMANDDYRTLLAMRDWPFLHRPRTISTVAATQFYNLPYDCDLVEEISVTVSSQRYTPRKSPSREHWDRLNITPAASNIPEWYFVYNGQVGLWPTPSSGSNTITVSQKTRVIDLGVADYSTGTIVSVANGGTAVVGSGTSWTSQMVGRYIRITHVDTANTGDGLWYEIAGVTNTTNLTLVRSYGGTSIAAGSAAYSIGQMPLLPEAFHDMPWLYAAGMYWMKEDDTRSQSFLNIHGSAGESGTPPTGKVKQLIEGYGAMITDPVVDDGKPDEILNPNLTISL